MEGTFDESIEEAQASTATKRSSAQSGTARQPVPGGKALHRLLSLLESRGYGDVAEALADTAVPDERKDDLAEMRTRSTASPGGESRPRAAPTARPAASRRGRG